MPLTSNCFLYAICFRKTTKLYTIRQIISASINSASLDNFIPYSLKNNVHFIQISTDFVFNGLKGPYDEDDGCDPINFYGISKPCLSKKDQRAPTLNELKRKNLLF